MIIQQSVLAIPLQGRNPNYPIWEKVRRRPNLANLAFSDNTWKVYDADVHACTKTHAVSYAHGVWSLIFPRLKISSLLFSRPIYRFSSREQNSHALHHCITRLIKCLPRFVQSVLNLSGYSSQEAAHARKLATSTLPASVWI